ncbi:MAG: SDR family NAD(P)-dependent oxidoreductase [Panacagrimonas sp.]
MSSFDKQIAVVTGASGGIGGAIGHAFAKAGAHVIAVGRNREKLSAYQAQLADGPGTCATFVADLTDDADIAALVDHVSQTHGRLDMLVLCSGNYARGKVEDAPVETMDALYRSNVRVPYLLSQRLLPLLRKPRGQLVFINSSSGLAARPNAVQYSATQHALKAIADGFRMEVNADQVRVLSVYPGRTATRLIETLTAEEGREYLPEKLLQPEDIAGAVAHTLSLPWTAEITDLSIRPMQKS